MVGLGFLALGGIGVASHGAEFPSLLVAMLARDEELLLKKHLPAWKQVGDSFLLGLDSRTQDDSAAVALSLLAPKPLQVYHFDFDGFGSAKSKLLQESYVKFPGMAYVLVVEPDMLPKGAPFSREPLRSQEPVYAVRRGGKESLGERLTDCVFRNDGNWYFRFRVHETPVYRNAGERGYRLVRAGARRKLSRQSVASGANTRRAETGTTGSQRSSWASSSDVLSRRVTI
eukprot:s467_g5.t1